MIFDQIKLRPTLTRIALAMTVALVFAASQSALSATTDIIGPAKVIDGDTIKINNTRIRIYGIDAPERKQTCMMPIGKTIRCGVIAGDTMRDLVTGATVICKQQDIDCYGRVVAICYVDGHDVGQDLVHAGWAVAYRKYSMKYVAIEDKSRAAKRGMWRGSFVKPWNWRRGKRLSSTRPPSATDCRIKGNISKSGKIYHKPGSRWYEATGIDLGKGERWFCSVDEAVRAGWRTPN